jgi:hypothetical protein
MTHSRLAAVNPDCRQRAVYHLALPLGMMRYRTVAQVEADLIALRAAAERAGMALACVFSSADEYEADLIRERRARGAFRPQRSPRHRLRAAALIGALAVAFLLI